MQEGLRPLRQLVLGPQELDLRRPGAPDRGALPPVEVYFTRDEVVLCAVLPGLPGPQHVAVSLAGAKEAVLEAFVPPPPARGALVLRERFSGYCHRSVTLPAAVLP